MLTSLLLFSAAVSCSARFHSEMCSKVEIECVAEGQACYTDSVSDCEGLYSLSKCNVCREGHVCHDNECVKKTRQQGETCGDSSALYCVDAFECVAGRCRDVDQTATNFLARGEECSDSVPNQCFSTGGLVSLSCNEANICELPGDKCDHHWAHCGYGEYCEEVGGGDRSCQPAIDKDIRDGFPCESHEQCGHGWYCLRRNTQTNVERISRKVCTKPFQVEEGGWCGVSTTSDPFFPELLGLFNVDIYCGEGLFCWNNICSKPDQQYAGNECEDPDECGRGMQCACPEFGGRREECVLGADVIRHNRNIKHFEYFQRFMGCLDDNKCKLKGIDYAHPDGKLLTGSCAWKHCRSRFDDIVKLVNPNQCSEDFSPLQTPYFDNSAPKSAGVSLVVALTAAAAGVLFF